MADKEQTKDVRDEVVTEKATSTPPVKPGAKTAAVVPPAHHSRRWVLGVVAGVIVLYIIIVLAGLWFLNAIHNRQTVSTSRPAGMTRQFGHWPGGYWGQQTFTQTSTSSDGLTSTSTTTTYTQTQGVVTAVNGDNIVVAGSGKSQKIMTNSSTTYVDDVKPAVNDTVVVVGTKDGDTITATQIAVYN